MNTTFWNLAHKIATDINAVQLSFAMLLGYLQGCEENGAAPMGDTPAVILPQIEHIEEGEKDDMRKLKRGDGSVTPVCRQKKDGTIRRYWRGRLYIAGKQETVYAGTKIECLKKLEALRDERDKLARTAEESPQPVVQASYRTYGDWLQAWLTICKEGKLKRSYKPQLEKSVQYVKDALGRLNLKSMRPLDILNYIARLPRCNNTVKLYDIINGSLQRAEDFGLIKKNPCKAVDRPTYDATNRRPFELWEQCALLNELQGKHKRLYFFLCCTGLRVGELLALDESKINFAQGYIRINADLDIKTGQLDTPKTKASVRNVYFAPELFEVFDINELGTFTYSGIKKAFCKAYKKLGLAEGISVTHSCRHTYASLLGAVQVAPKVVQAQMGHASLSTTMDVYTDLLAGGTSSPIYEYVLKLKEVLKQKIL